LSVFDIFYPSPTGSLIVLFILGASFLFRKYWYLAVVCVLPLLLLEIAAFSIYPLVPRLVLFMAPLLSICITFGLFSILNSRLGFLPPAILLFLIITPPFFITLERTINPYYVHEMRPALEVLARHFRQDDIIYVTLSAEATFSYYARQLGIPRSQAIIARKEMDSEQLASVLNQNRRTWIIWSWAPDAERVWLDRVLSNEEERFFVSRSQYPLVVRYFLFPKAVPFEPSLLEIGGWLPKSASLLDPEGERLRLQRVIDSGVDIKSRAEAALALAELEQRFGNRLAMRRALVRAVEAEGSGALAFEAARRLARDFAAEGDLSRALAWYREAAKRMQPWTGLAYAEAAGAARSAGDPQTAAQFAEESIVAYRTQLQDPNVPGLLRQVGELLAAVYEEQGRRTAAEWARYAADRVTPAEARLPADPAPATRLHLASPVSGSGAGGVRRLGAGETLRYAPALATEGVLRIDTRGEAGAPLLRVVVRRAVSGDLVRELTVTTSPSGEITLLSVPSGEQLTVELVGEPTSGAAGSITVFEVVLA
ncbi:MAG: hypothetical protein NZ773_04815, partial [Dehalococcoidia bacterium]|nr:hypothetical protein [Dehalococcoidia bacterium]